MRPIKPGSNKDNKLLPLSLFFVTVASRIPFTSKFLYHWDSVQFSLALEKYDITTHQPHPPGYFLYVMFGRLLSLFINDANTIFVTISIVFSGLTVVAIYYLAKELYDSKTGVLAAGLAITSPNLWFHGEVALTYIVEAFFSTAVAFLCLKILKGEHRNLIPPLSGEKGHEGGVAKYLWLSVFVIGIAGGIRQNTIVFLLPLWLFSIKGLPMRKIITSFMLLGLVCLLWFIPMVSMTGGLNVYREAFRELWLFNTGYVSVFKKGLSPFKIFSSALTTFTFYGLGAGALILSLAAYSIIRRGRLIYLDRSKALFFSLWILPSVMFYLLIFIHPANPGYVLIFLPALLILAAASIGYVAEDLRQFAKKDFFAMIVLFVISINTALFFIAACPVTFREIKNHDRDLAVMLDEIKSFEPSKTAIFVRPYLFYGYRHIMYYLPDYRVYDVDMRVAPTGEIRKLFWGSNRETFLSDKIILPEGIEDFVFVLVSDDYKEKAQNIRGISAKSLDLTHIYIVFGHDSLIKQIYPELDGRMVM